MPSILNIPRLGNPPDLHSAILALGHPSGHSHFGVTGYGFTWAAIVRAQSRDSAWVVSTSRS
jgi:hypothetical protein